MKEKITIHKSAKEDFKQMMGWNENQFKFHTKKIEERYELKKRKICPYCNATGYLLNEN